MEKKIDGSIIFRTVVACSELFRAPDDKIYDMKCHYYYYCYYYCVSVWVLNLSFRRDFSLRQIRKFQRYNNNENNNNKNNNNNNNNNYNCNDRTVVIPICWPGNRSTNSMVHVTTLIRWAPLIHTTSAPKSQNYYMLLNVNRKELCNIILLDDKIYSLYRDYHRVRIIVRIKRYSPLLYDVYDMCSVYLQRLPKFSRPILKFEWRFHQNSCC